MRCNDWKGDQKQTQLRRSTLTAMIRKDVHSFGLGAPSIYMEYHRRSVVALVKSLEDPSARHQSVTIHLLTHQVAKLKALATSFLSKREKTLLPIKRQLNLHMRARQLARIHASKLHLALKGSSMFLDDLKLTLLKQLRNKYTRIFKKHIIALNRLAVIANLPGTQELSPTSIAQIFQERNSEQSIRTVYPT